MSASFTPGPWSTDGVHIVAPTKSALPGIAVATWCDTPETHANARLMAAAPELYEALELAWDYACQGTRLGHDDVSAVVNAALAKARGAAQ